MSIQAIVFDFGGVLAEVDRQKLLDFASSSLDLSKEDLAQLLLQYRETRSLDESEEDFWKRFASYIKKTLPENWMEKWKEAKVTAIEKLLGMQELVDHLKEQGYKVAILSNVRKEQAELLRKLGYYDGFDPVFLSCETGVEKPDPKAFSNLLNKLQLDKDAVLYVDDQPLNVEEALRLGIDSILFFSLPQLRKELQKRGISC